MRRRARARSAATVVVLALLAGCHVRTVGVEGSWPNGYAGFSDVAVVPGEGPVTWACTHDGSVLRGEGLRFKYDGAPDWSIPCHGDGHVVVAEPGVWVLSSVGDLQGPDGAGVQLELVDLEAGFSTTPFTRPVPDGVRYPWAGHLAIDQWIPYLGLRDPVTGGFSILTLTGPDTWVVVPGTTGLGERGFVLDAAGGLFAIDGHQIVHVDPSGVREVVAGTGERGFSGDGGPAVDARFDDPLDLAVDAAGDLLVADAGNGRIRKVDPGGGVTTLVGGGNDETDGATTGDARLRWPTAVAADSQPGCLWYTDLGPPEGPDDTSQGRLRFAGPTSCPGHPENGG